ncbi:MAG TPA: FAD-dependent thymidylate synthase [bacterium]|jgi:flavin-dependent thymidylate synthase
MGLSVRLAGYNLDADLLSDVLDLLVRLEQGASDLEAGGYQAADSRQFVTSLAETVRTRLDTGSFTPETLSAAYARISRDPKQVTELRRAARFGVARARKSNENIIFGLGHASVAEHACFNFDVLGLSRLASEELQSHRLLSFTEKSQRYITLTTDYVVAPEVKGTADEVLFHETIPRLFQSYQTLSEILAAGYLKGFDHEAMKDEVKEAENRAKEDARYLLPLACSTQMGMTVNARMIEHVVRDLSDHPLQELRDLGRRLYESLKNLAPSVVKYVVRDSYPRENRRGVCASIGDAAQPLTGAAVITSPTVRLVQSTPDGEAVVLRALAFTCGKADSPSPDIWRTLFRGMGPHDGALREFELASMTFEAEISASCFAQLKRHRMMTMLTQPYRLEDGVITPPSLMDAQLEAPFREAVETALEAARKLSARSPLLAPYFLTNAHRKRVMIHMNAREFYHFARLRADSHAQWEIRLLAEQMLEQARALWPNLFMLACGKDQFAAIYDRVFGSV